MRKMAGTLTRLTMLAAVLAGAGGVLWWWHDFRTGTPEEHTVDVGELLTGVTVSGTVRNQQKTALAAEVVAAVAEIAVTEGQVVKQGQVLIRLDDSVVAAEIAKSQACVELARENLAELKAGARKEAIDQARQAVSAAASELSYAKTNNDRVQRLAKQDVANSSEVLLSQKKLQVAQAQLKSAQAGVALLLAGARPEQIARAEAEIRLALAELKRCEALRGKYRLHAPHAGVVTAKYVHVGEVVSPGQVLLHLNNVAMTEIRAQVQETQLAGVLPGHQARVLADAYPDQPLDAVVEQILPRVDPQSGTVTVLLRLARPTSMMLMDGMAVDIALIRERHEEVVRVPVEAVQGQGDRAEVWVKSGEQFVRRQISAGATDGQWVEIKAGLTAGEVVRVN